MSITPNNPNVWPFGPKGQQLAATHNSWIHQYGTPADWEKFGKPIFYLKKMSYRHYVVTNEAGEVVHHIRGTRPEARGQFDAYVRKLEKITDLLIK